MAPRAMSARRGRERVSLEGGRLWVLAYLVVLVGLCVVALWGVGWVQAG